MEFNLNKSNYIDTENQDDQLLEDDEMVYK